MIANPAVFKSERVRRKFWRMAVECGWASPAIRFHGVRSPLEAQDMMLYSIDAGSGSVSTYDPASGLVSGFFRGKLWPKRGRRTDAFWGNSANPNGIYDHYALKSFREAQRLAESRALQKRRERNHQLIERWRHQWSRVILREVKRLLRLINALRHRRGQGPSNALPVAPWIPYRGGEARFHTDHQVEFQQIIFQQIEVLHQILSIRNISQK